MHSKKTILSIMINKLDLINYSILKNEIYTLLFSNNPTNFRITTIKSYLHKPLNIDISIIYSQNISKPNLL